MKTTIFLRSGVLMAALAGLAALPGIVFADDLTPPVVVQPIGDLTVAAGTTSSVVNLKRTFGLSGVTGTIVRMATVVGNIDIELLDTETPKNVANFLGYVNDGRYNKSFIHRSVETPTPFVIQGGGYYVDGSGQINAITTDAPVMGEHARSNTRGTMALALSSGPDSGTSQWFFNLADNTMLDDASDGGPFTVFARVIEGDMANVDAIAALPYFDFTKQLGSPFTNLPLYNYDASVGAGVNNLVYVNDAVVIPVIPLTDGADGVLTLTVKNSNHALLDAKMVGKKLKLTYVAGQTGTARIKVYATDSAGSRIKSRFMVTVQ